MENNHAKSKKINRFKKIKIKKKFNKVNKELSKMGMSIESIRLTELKQNKIGFKLFLNK